MKVPGRPHAQPTTPAQLPDQPYLLMAAAHMQSQGNLLNAPPPQPSPPNGTV